MSRFVRQSQLRNLVVDPVPVDQTYSEIEAGDVQSRGDLVACSAKYIAFVSSHNSSSSVGVLDVAVPGKQHGHTVESCQQGSVLDLKFSPHNPGILASGAGNGTVAIWNVSSGDDGKVGLENTRVFGDVGGKRVNSMSWHPSANGVLSSLVANNVQVWDANSANSDPMFSIDIGAPTMSCSWSSNGQFVACLSEDKALRLVDPRQGSVVGQVDGAHKGSRALGRVVAGGTTGHGELSNFVYTTGFNLTRDREVCVWDVRKLDESCLVRHKVGSGTGILIPVIIPDPKILFLVGKGDASLRSFEATGSSPFIYNVSQTTTASDPFLGVCALDVAACDVMGCEVSRLFKLSRSKVEPIRVEIPRRLKQVFHEEIFPDTVNVLQSAQSAESWKSGEDVDQPLVPVQTLQEMLAGGTQADSSAPAVESSEAPAPPAEQEEQGEGNGDEMEKEEEPKVYEQSSVDKRMSKLMGYVPKFKYSRGNQVKKEETIYNLQPANPACVAVGESKFAISWQGGGGPVYVGDVNDVGKIDNPQSVPVLNGHTRPVFAIDFSPFDDSVLATGADDCHICVWRDSENVQLSGHQGSVRHVKFHPTTDGLIASGGQDGTVLLWDAGAQRLLRDEPLVQDEEVTTCLAWDYCGSRLAVMNRANAMYLADARSSSPATISIDKTHQGAKQCYTSWLSESSILTSGCARMGYREFAIWDTRKLDNALSRTKIDTGATAFEPFFVEENGVVIFIARGENTFHVYEIQDLAKTEIKPDHASADPLRPHKCNTFIAGGEPTSAAAIAPRRSCNTKKTEWAKLFRLTPSTFEPVSFTIPRAADLADYFADDVYAETRSSVPVYSSADSWLAGEDSAPNLMSMNTTESKRLSSRDPALAHAAMKKAQASTARFRERKAEEEARKKDTEDAFSRMQHLAAQHEYYNPNLSKHGARHDAARLADSQLDDGGEVSEGEWDDDSD